MASVGSKALVAVPADPFLHWTRRGRKRRSSDGPAVRIAAAAHTLRATTLPPPRADAASAAPATSGCDAPFHLDVGARH